MPTGASQTPPTREDRTAWDAGLEGIHRQIAASDDPAVWVVAGPGTGKTFAMIRKVARLLEEDVPPERVLAATFTRTAAQDLRYQLQAIGVEGADRVQGVRAGAPRAPTTIFLPFDSRPRSRRSAIAPDDSRPSRR